MEEKFRKAQIVTLAMIASIVAYGVFAWIVSDGRGYGASSEGKMNFIRMILFFFSGTQILLAFSIQKMSKASSKNPDPSKRFVQQMLINAFCEAIALFGIVLVFMSKAFTDYLIFATIALAAFALFFPRRKDWEPSPEKSESILVS